MKSSHDLKIQRYRKKRGGGITETHVYISELWGNTRPSLMK